MRIAQEDEQRIQPHLEHITDRGTLDAYWYIVGFSESLLGFQPRPFRKGAVLDYRFFRNDEQWFAFIVNRNSLLFYFRLPAVRSGRYSKDELIRKLREVRENRRGEITTRISTVMEARRVMKAVFSNEW
jgi:hypothetical protein